MSLNNTTAAWNEGHDVCSIEDTAPEPTPAAPASWRVVVKQPGQKPHIASIPGNLQGMQNVVGGYIERFTVPGISEEIDCWCNDEGLINGLQPNFGVGGHPICGTVFFAGVTDEGETIGLTDEQVREVLAFWGSVPTVHAVTD